MNDSEKLLKSMSVADYCDLLSEESLMRMIAGSRVTESHKFPTVPTNATENRNRTRSQPEIIEAQH